MAGGLLFIHKNPTGVSSTPTPTLFGEITIVSRTDIWLSSILAVAVIVLAFLCHRQFRCHLLR